MSKLKVVTDGLARYNYFIKYYYVINYYYYCANPSVMILRFAEVPTSLRANRFVIHPT